QARVRPRHVPEASSIQTADPHVFDRLGLYGKIGGLRPSHRDETRRRAQEKAFHHLHVEPPGSVLGGSPMMRSHPRSPLFPRTPRRRPPPELPDPKTDQTETCALTPNAATRGMPPSVAVNTLPEVFRQTMKNTPPHSPNGAIPKRCCTKNTKITSNARVSRNPSAIDFYRYISII